MATRTDAPAWVTVTGYGLGVGICFMATVGVWLQYSTTTFTAVIGGASSLAAGFVLGGGWFLLRHRGRA